MATEILTFIGSIDTNSEVKMNGPVRDGLNPGSRADVIRLYKKAFLRVALFYLLCSGLLMYRVHAIKGRSRLAGVVSPLISGRPLRFQAKNSSLFAFYVVI